MNYRIDFVRKVRSLEDIETNITCENFTGSIEKSIGRKLFMTIPEAWTLDSKTVRDVAGMTGKEVLAKHILPLYPEAEISCWDCWNDGELRTMQDLE